LFVVNLNIPINARGMEEKGRAQTSTYVATICQLFSLPPRAKVWSVWVDVE
jgi:hypothetical protein